MALALYRKYRPATFAEVVGQEHVTDPLCTALAAGRVNHAYLFSGPRGCGKTSSARIMARSLNCVEGPTPEPCGTCPSCVGLAPEGPGSVDVTELDAASHGGVEDARELRDRAFYAPAESRYRVFIIDEAHMVTTQGFNALLKVVEEPPAHVIFIFATTEPEKVLPTIRSRTHHYPFRLLPPGAMRQLLERNVAAEGAQVDPAVYPLVIRAGGGSARDTQSILDQLLAGAGSGGIDYSRAVALLGVTDVALIDDLIDGLAADDSAAVFYTVDQLAEAGHDPRRFTTDLLDRLRDLILLRSVPDAATKNLVAAPEEELIRMGKQAAQLGSATLSRYAEIVHNGLLEMRGATAPRLLLELLCARMLLPAASDDEGAVLQRLEQLERRMTVSQSHVGASAASAASVTPVAPVAKPPAQQPTQQPAQPTKSVSRPEQPSAEPSIDKSGNEEAATKDVGSEAPGTDQVSSRSATPKMAIHTPQPANPDSETAEQATASAEPTEVVIGGIDVTAVRRAWPQVMSALRKTPGNRSTEAMLMQAGVQEVDGTTVVLTHTVAPLARRLAEQHNTDRIATALREVLGGDWQVRCVHAAASSEQRHSSGSSEADSRSAAPQTPAPASEPAVATPQTTPPGQVEQPEQTQAQVSEPASKPTAEPDNSADSLGGAPESEPRDEFDAMEAEAGDEPGEDPEAAARKLLADHLGARPLD